MMIFETKFNKSLISSLKQRDSCGGAPVTMHVEQVTAQLMLISKIEGKCLSCFSCGKDGWLLSIFLAHMYKVMATKKYTD